MNRILDWLTTLHFRVFGSSKLTRLEAQVLDGWRGILRSDERSLLERQLQQVSFIQRGAGGAKVAFYYRRGCEIDRGIGLLGEPLADLHVATVYLGTRDDRATLRAKIYVHQGRFFSIEFPKRPSRYLEQHQLKEEELILKRAERHDRAEDLTRR